MMGVVGMRHFSRDNKGLQHHIIQRGIIFTCQQVFFSATFSQQQSKR